MITHVSFDSWLNSLMWKGFRHELKHKDLYATPEESRSQELQKRFNKLVTFDGLFTFISNDATDTGCTRKNVPERVLSLACGLLSFNVSKSYFHYMDSSLE